MTVGWWVFCLSAGYIVRSMAIQIKHDCKQAIALKRLDEQDFKARPSQLRWLPGEAPVISEVYK